MDTLQIALIGLIIILVVAFIYYTNPMFLTQTDGFTTIAVEATKFPKCLVRSYDAQELLQQLHAGVKTSLPSSDAAMAYDELKLIVQKALCMDADITGMGAGPYTTYALPYNTQHDIEPVASFVGRCLRNAVRTQDIDVLFDKLQTRGNELIEVICTTKESRQRAFTLFQKVLNISASQISSVCLKPQPVMDIPPGVRDPGYFLPPELTRLSDYKEYGQ